VASLSDIPEKLLKPDMRIQFVEWLLGIPLPPETRIALARTWERFTQRRIDATTWILIAKHPDG